MYLRKLAGLPVVQPQRPPARPSSLSGVEQSRQGNRREGIREIDPRDVVRPPQAVVRSQSAAHPPASHHEQAPKPLNRPSQGGPEQKQPQAALPRPEARVSESASMVKAPASATAAPQQSGTAHLRPQEQIMK